MPVSCRNTTPELALSDEKIARITAELALADAATLGATGYAKDSMAQMYYRQVFEMQGVRREDYIQAYYRLAEDLPRMEKVMQMADSLTRIRLDKNTD